MTTVALIDAGGANLGSVRYALERLGARVQVVTGASDIAGAERVILPGRVAKLAASPGTRVPHMGWNRLHIERRDPLLDGIEPHDQAYFVHGYAAPVTAATLASCDHGGPFAAVVRSGNRCGAQFHPERSASVGARLLENFLADRNP